MTKREFTDAATATLGRFGDAAHRTIELYREGGERIAAVVNERWDTAFDQAEPQLSPETRKNARNFKQVCGRCWSRGVALSADGAKIAVDTLVGAAIAGVERAAGHAPAHP
jgi:hypothetical protein